jgi:hypothetical protein
MTTLQRDEAALTTQLRLGPFSNKRHAVKVLILNMVATSNMISCNQLNTSCLIDWVQLCHILVAEFTPWHTSLGGKLIPPSCMPTCAALHQKAAYRINPWRPLSNMEFALASYCGIYALFSTLVFPSFFVISFSLKIWNIRVLSVDRLPESSVCLLNNSDEMENSLCQEC